MENTVAKDRKVSFLYATKEGEDKDKLELTC
jgi:hypothetical protein